MCQKDLLNVLIKRKMCTTTGERNLILEQKTKYEYEMAGGTRRGELRNGAGIQRPLERPLHASRLCIGRSRPQNW